MAEYTLRQLHCFVAVADAGSLSGAAATLRVTPTAVASALTELERILRTQLVVRRKAHGVSLTPTGVYLRKRAAVLLRDAEELRLMTASGGTELAGPLTLGCYVTVSPTILPLLLRWTAEHHPKVQLDVVARSQQEITALLFAGALDLAIVYDMGLPDGLESVLLYMVRPYVVLPADHRLAGAGSVSLAELAEEPLILLDLPPAAQHTLRVFEQAGVTPRVAQRTTDFELTRSLVARGLGYSVLVQRPAVDRSYEGLPLTALEIDPPVAGVGVQMVWPSGVRLTDRAQALAGFAAAQARFTDYRHRNAGAARRADAGPPSP
ncbi:LysR family transcriptional regulator [Modestobacter roseus]|uniref:DNA-binding transcriptional LysR family regulator n=1 Tax=Modestobacter roseus TaxID=1181884 RepID=A0A562IP14_9ACTN|nr:LysR family transcriptional regulator [Modestobacter roseus]MQA34430.1 LysR family transcriptional regulator [Modestobacter roseus]TWH72757.1 DNA-binding transcriptional LysR family regulator [Modestobacter roseus]